MVSITTSTPSTYVLILFGSRPCASVTPSHFENFRQAWQKCVAKYGNARPRPKQDKYVVLRTRSTSVKKERRGFPSRD